ncbi:hypothetical protein [Sphingopyxis witflariensis]|uniref:hypothetical protein n=1 Tax=Sphingopyxis witflariensis TaxID=173675 RepID=UPI001181983F|nr:hypothetical protein [Sphingopyxis witflariensis]
MTAGAVRKNKMRTALLAGLGLSTIWAAYWLWPAAAAKPDFLFDTHSTSIVDFHDLTKDIRPELPYFQRGSFHSPDGKRLRPRDIIRDARDPDNIDSPDFIALFRLKTGTTRADFVTASRAIWAVCDSAIAVASDDREDAPTLLPVKHGKDCGFLFPDTP